MATLEIDFTNETAVSVELAPIKQHLEQVLKRLGEEAPCALELTIANEARVQQLNRDFLQHDYATDVLSFPAPDGVGESDQKMLGSIIVCEPVARKQAAQAGITLESELTMLASHSLLHLLGYHHQ